MGQYLVKRLIQVPIVLWILITISFVMMRVTPGGPFSGEKRMDPVIQEKINQKYHLDESMGRQYLRFMKELLLTADLGPSFKNKTQTVNEILVAKFPTSVWLGLSSIFIALWLGLGAGILAGIRQNSNFDYGSMAVAMIGLSVPTFVVGPLLQLFFSMGLPFDWLPVAGWESPFEHPWEAFKLLIMPSFCLALPFAARIARLTRAGMLEVINQDYIRTAWAKGLSERVIVIRHALRGAMLPVVSFLGPGIAAMLTGSLVVEQIFGIPGVGMEFVKSTLNRDYTLVMGTVILYGVLLVGLNLFVDIIYGFLDPRIRYS